VAEAARVFFFWYLKEKMGAAFLQYFCDTASLLEQRPKVRQPFSSLVFKKELLSKVPVKLIFRAI